jgi:two-component sensor histidine kinase
LRIEIKEIKESLSKGKIIQLETERTKSSGEIIEVSMISFGMEFNGKKTGSYQIFKEINTNEQNGDSFRNALLEKEMLLKEIHHRVKNNLQIVSSLLFLQSKALNDEKTVNILLESHNRVKSIALIHEKLYQSANISRIDFDRYLNTLIPHLLQSFGKTNSTVSYTIKAGNIYLSPDTAIPCGLIINEIVTNSLKYAFTDGRKGEISIELIYHNNNNVTLIVKDNGVGIQDNLDITKAESLGLQIIVILVKQLNGTVEVNKANGTLYKITFPFNEYSSRQK